MIKHIGAHVARQVCNTRGTTNKHGSVYIQTKTEIHQQAQQYDTSSVCTLPQAGLWVPAVGRLVPCLLYLCLKGAAPMKLRPQSAGWAGLGWAPRALRVWVPCSVRLLLQAGWQEEEELIWGGG